MSIILLPFIGSLKGIEHYKKVLPVNYIHDAGKCQDKHAKYQCYCTLY